MSIMSTVNACDHMTGHAIMRCHLVILFFNLLIVRVLMMEITAAMAWIGRVSVQQTARSDAVSTSDGLRSILS